MRCALHHAYIFFNEFKDLGAYEQLIQKQLPIPLFSQMRMILIYIKDYRRAVYDSD